MDNHTKLRIFLLLWLYYHRNIVAMCVIYIAYKNRLIERERVSSTRGKRWSLISKMPDQFKNLRSLVNVADSTCIENLRMDRDAFARLCYLMEHVGGLKDERYVSVTEKTALLLSVLAHHQKNVVVKKTFARSGHTISKYFKEAIRAIIRLGPLLLVEPTPVEDNCNVDPWKHFKGCLGALDGTFLDVRVNESEQIRYRNRKGRVAVNLLGVCNRDLNFIYILTGWEGSAADSRVLRDAIHRPNGLRVPQGNYYLCDCGYMNATGFLTPYRSTRYHLKEWGIGTAAPQTPKEFFNMQHSKARNVIERTFGILKGRWAILRSNTFYNIKYQNYIIMACALLHNYIRTRMSVDPYEEESDSSSSDDSDDEDEFEVENAFVDTIEGSVVWSNWRDDLANTMFSEWRNSS